MQDQAVLVNNNVQTVEFMQIPTAYGLDSQKRRNKMGRPINNKYIGNTSGSGQQIQATAYIPGMTKTSTAYIIKQTATNTYNMANVSGIESGSVQLVNGGVSLAPGQANITVTPYGAGGSGATAVANLAINSARVGTATGSTATYYVPGQTLTVTGGTSSVGGTLSVSAVKAGIANVVSSGNGYTVGDTFTYAYAGFDTAPVLAVASTTGNGVIATLSVSVPGSVSNVSVTNVTPYSSSVRANAGATGATFAVRWDPVAFGVSNRGNYSSAPSNNVATSGSSTGSGATAVLDWRVASARVTNGGSGYTAATVAFSSGNASGVATTNVAGSITSVTITASGTGYTNTAPTITIAPLGSVQYASEIRNRSVTTFSGNTYEWSMTGTTLTSSDQANIQSA